MPLLVRLILINIFIITFRHIRCRRFLDIYIAIILFTPLRSLAPSLSDYFSRLHCHCWLRSCHASILAVIDYRLLGFSHWYLLMASHCAIIDYLRRCHFDATLLRHLGYYYAVYAIVNITDAFFSLLLMMITIITPLMLCRQVTFHIFFFWYATPLLDWYYAISSLLRHAAAALRTFHAALITRHYAIFAKMRAMLYFAAITLRHVFCRWFRYADAAFWCWCYGHHITRLLRCRQIRHYFRHVIAALHYLPCHWCFRHYWLFSFHAIDIACRHYYFFDFMLFAMIRYIITILHLRCCRVLSPLPRHFSMPLMLCLPYYAIFTLYWCCRAPRFRDAAIAEFRRHDISLRRYAAYWLSSPLCHFRRFHAATFTPAVALLLTQSRCHCFRRYAMSW